MSLSQREKSKVIFYLGWSGLTIVEGSTHFNSVVNDRISVDNDEICRIAKIMIGKLEKCDEQLDAAKCRLAASSVDGVKMNQHEISQLKKERLRCIRELSDHLDIPITKSGGMNRSVVC